MGWFDWLTGNDPEQLYEAAIDKASAELRSIHDRLLAVQAVSESEKAKLKAYLESESTEDANLWDVFREKLYEVAAKIPQSELTESQQKFLNEYGNADATWYTEKEYKNLDFVDAVTDSTKETIETVGKTASNLLPETWKIATPIVGLAVIAGAILIIRSKG